MRVGRNAAGGTVVGDDHEACFEEKVFDKCMLPFRGDPRLTDAEYVHEGELDGHTPSCNEGGWGASGAVGLECPDACGVDAFRGHVIPNARAWAEMGVDKTADWEIESFVVAGMGFFGAIRIRVLRRHGGQS